MNKKTSYFCEVCGKAFDNEIDCKAHEERHSICRCQGGESPEHFQLYEVIAYGKSERIYVDYRFPAIVKHRNYSDVVHKYIYPDDKIPIKFCPFCGRELKGGAE